jgi:hypothetical protein
MNKLAKGVGIASDSSGNCSGNGSGGSTSSSDGGSSSSITAQEAVGDKVTPTISSQSPLATTDNPQGGQQPESEAVLSNANNFQLVSGTLNGAYPYHQNDSDSGGGIKFRVGDVVTFSLATGDDSVGNSSHSSGNANHVDEETASQLSIEAVVIDVHTDQAVLTVFFQEQAMVVDMAKCTRVSKSTDFEV